MSYSTEVIADSPIAYWRMGEASPATTADNAEGNAAKDGTYTNCVSGNYGSLGAIPGDTAITFTTAQNNFVQLPSISELDGVGEVAIECFVKVTALSSTYVIISNSNGGDFPLKISINSTGKIVHTSDGSVGTRTKQSTDSITAGTFWWIAVVRDASRVVRFYRRNLSLGAAGSIADLADSGNGAQTAVEATRIGASGADARIGRNQSSASVSEQFGGTIDEVSAFVSITEARLLVHYNAAANAKGITLTEPAAAAQFPLAVAQNITWTYQGIIANVKVEETRDASAGTPTWTTLTASVANTGSYSWTPSGATSADCKVRVSDASDAAVVSTSGTFSITESINTIAVTSQAVGTVSTLTAVVPASCTRVKVRWSFDSGVTWETPLNGECVGVTGGTVGSSALSFDVIWPNQPQVRFELVDMTEVAQNSSDNVGLGAGIARVWAQRAKAYSTDFTSTGAGATDSNQGAGGLSGQTLTPGKSVATPWTGMVNPYPGGFGTGTYRSRACIARWNCIPYRRTSNPGETPVTAFKIGLVAFHINGIDRVEFRAAVNGYQPGAITTVRTPSLNSETGTYDEYWCNLDLTGTADGDKIVIDAIVYPIGSGRPLVLTGAIGFSLADTQFAKWYNGIYSMILWANPTGTLDASKVFYVDGVNGIDSGTGTNINSPVATIGYIARNIANQYATIYVIRAGRYTIDRTGMAEQTTSERFLTIKKHSSVVGDVIIDGTTAALLLDLGRWHYIKFDGIKIQPGLMTAISSTQGASSNTGILWLDNCEKADLYPDRGTWSTSYRGGTYAVNDYVVSGGQAYVCIQANNPLSIAVTNAAYWTPTAAQSSSNTTLDMVFATNSSTHDSVYAWPSCMLVRNCTADLISGDAMQNCGFVCNSTFNRIDGTISSHHTDSIQLLAPNGPPYQATRNVIYYNTRYTNCVDVQVFFNDNVEAWYVDEIYRDVAVVNFSLNQILTGGVAQPPLWQHFQENQNVLIAFATTVNQTVNLRALLNTRDSRYQRCDPRGLVFYGCSVWHIADDGDGQVNEINTIQCHYQNSGAVLHGVSDIRGGIVFVDSSNTSTSDITPISGSIIDNVVTGWRPIVDTNNRLRKVQGVGNTAIGSIVTTLEAGIIVGINSGGSRKNKNRKLLAGGYI